MPDPRKKEKRRKVRQAKKRRDTARQPKKSPFDDLAPERACGGCKECCTGFTILGMKERGEHCEHECEAGCAIYSTRPTQCSGFACAWIIGWGGEDDRPDKRGWMVFSDDTYPQFVQLAGAGSKRKSLVRIQELREREELTEPRLAQAISEFVQAHAAVLVSGEDDDGRWIALYGPRLPKGIMSSWADLEKLAQGAAPKCILCGSELRYVKRGPKARMECADALGVSCSVHGPSVPMAHGKAGAVARYNEWAARARVNVEGDETSQ